MTAPGPSARLSRLLEHRLTLRTTAIAGPATHIPGLFYLVALNVIVANDPGAARQRRSFQENHGRR